MAAHVHVFTLEDVVRVPRMQRIGLAVHGTGQIVVIIALDGVSEKDHSGRDGDRENQEKLLEPRAGQRLLANIFEIVR